jgi:hypothetical protein
MGSDVKSVAHFLTGLEIGDALRCHGDSVARSWIATGSTISCACRKSAETAKLNAPVGSKLFDDIVEETFDDCFNIANIQTGVFGGKVGDEFRTDHDFFLRFTVPEVVQWPAWLKLTTWLPKRTGT